MGAPTGVLTVNVGGTATRYEWNGNVEDREKARAAFDQARAGGYFAVVHDGPRSATQIRSFTEAEKIERERGTVTVEITTPMVGG